MPAMHDGDRQVPEALEGRAIDIAVGMIGIIDQGAVIDDVP